MNKKVPISQNILLQAIPNSKKVISYLENKDKSKIQKKTQNFENFLLSINRNSDSIDEILRKKNSNSKIFFMTFFLNEMKRNYENYLSQIEPYYRHNMSFNKFIGKIGNSLSFHRILINFKLN